MPAITVDVKVEKGLTITKTKTQPRHRSGAKATDIDEFLGLVAEAWEDYQNRNAVPRSRFIPIKYMHPKEFIEEINASSQSDVIVFHIVNRRRWNTTADGERRPRSPELREIKDDPNNENCTISIFAEKRENTVEFAIWSRYSKNANSSIMRFESFMEAYDWYFAEKGNNRVWFEERLEDKTEVIGGTEFAVRPLRYLVITELIYKEIDKKLRRIFVRFDSGLKLNAEETISNGIEIETLSIDH